jgi:CSLREA domain-containing protein
MKRKTFWMAALVLTLVLAPLPVNHVARANAYTVNTVVDENDGNCADADCSLRDAIILTNNSLGPDTINFNIPGCGGVCTIQPTLGALPALSGGGITINGYSQSGALEATDTTSATLLIEIDGANIGYNSVLWITSAGNTIKGLVINNSSAYGIEITNGASGNTVSGNYIGTDASGTVDRGNGWDGVLIGSGAWNNTIGGDTPADRNIISGNDQNGVYIWGSGTLSNTVSGNYIGTDANGTSDLCNSLDGVRIYNGAHDNIVGGDTAGERNVISGNNGNGVYIWWGSGTTGNTVSGNYIGTDASGTAALGNSVGGVRISTGPQNNTIGGDTAGERNVISGNNGNGVWIDGSNTTGNTVSGNYIGTDASGAAALGNGASGISINNTSRNNVIGGNIPGERNVISGNDYDGVRISSSGTMSNTVSGNYIGTDASGTADLGNTLSGVSIYNGAQNNVIGGNMPGERNVISGNDDDGVCISSSGTMSNTVSGNYIGTDASGTADLGNSRHGVSICDGAQNNTVGPGNVIAHNAEDGVWVHGGSTIGNVITQNGIFSNGWLGIHLQLDANGGIAAPVIVTTTFGSVNVVGTACAECAVEVFENSDAYGEGETYVGSATANASGDFTVTVSYLTKPYLTATATDVISGTSEFSAVFNARVSIYLPLVLRSFQ